jgi:hypothetical protein
VNDEQVDPKDEFGAILDELLSLYPNMTALRLREGHRKSAHVAHGWYQRVRRSCEAVVALEELGFGPEGAPIRRAIIEHTVALKWLADAGDGVLDVLALEHAARAKRIMKATQGANWSSVDQGEIQSVIDAIDEESLDHENAQYKQFSKQNQDQGVLAAYLAEIGRSHATYQSAVDYMDVERGALRAVSRASIDNVKMAADFLLEGTIWFHSMLEDPEWVDALTGLTERSRAANDRVRERQGLPVVEWDSL